ncbi:hypothetical protein AM571_CH01443 [Rhizobium etli 8C-3]|uniref:Peptidase S74 domain-containing protein n=1 Tax=Rhizobium etli 8C-3 TaxID=538025 RepID=A0A1L5P2B5_RHIET|nr:pyocin knob domain-containing S74 family peptidase [Rhizobium etli]APO74278.1 hypothetical protein AM571_CH01443 [Rhizobium etli 8C-3]
MTAPYTSGQVTLVNGSAAVVGVATGWATALIAGGVLFVEADGNALPILGITDDTHLTAAVKWKGASGTYPYAIVRDTAYLQQLTTNSQALAALVQELGGDALTALAALTPAANKVPYFNGEGSATLADFRTKGRAIAAANTMSDLLSELGPVFGGICPVPSAAGVGLADGNMNTINVRGEYTIAGDWTNGPDGAGAVTYSGVLDVMVRTFNNFFKQIFYRSGGRIYSRESTDGATWTTWLLDPALNTANTWTAIQTFSTATAFSASITVDAGSSYSAILLNRSGMNAAIEALASPAFQLGTQTAHPVIFRVNNVERARFEPTNGDFLIGTTATIDPASGSTVGLNVRCSTGRMWRRVSGYNPFIQARLVSEGTLQEFYYGASSVGTIAVTSTSTTFNTTSDYRLKTNVEPLVTFSVEPEDFASLNNALLRVLAYRPVSYNWIATGELSHGFIAHELQGAAPHAVTGEKDAIRKIGRITLPDREEQREILLPDRIGEREVIDPVTGETYVETYTIKGETRIETYTVKGSVLENVDQSEMVEGATWEETGEVPVYQVVDHSKLVPDLVAAVQALTMTVLELRREVDTLKSA